MHSPTNPTGRYVLDGKIAVECPDLRTWAQWMERAERHVADERIGDTRISTAFLGLDHNHHDDGPPLLFETMIFGGKHNDYQTRCSTWEQAEAQHAEAVALVRKTIQ